MARKSLGVRFVQTNTRYFDDVMTSRPLFVPGPNEVGAFHIERHGEEGVRLVMREPHFANNVRYVLVVDRYRGRLRAHWSDSDDETPRGGLTIGLA